MNLQEVLDKMEEKMMKTLEVVQHEFATVRTGKASTALVENIQVEAYGAQMRLREVAGLSTPEPRLIVIQPWDPSIVPAVVKAIQMSSLGIQPVSDGKIIRIPIPELDQERRQQLDKHIKKLAEDGRIAIRNERREAMEATRKLQKEGKITEDELRRAEKEIQAKTDEYIKEIDTILAHKEKEILSV
ncbi:MAG: ribosome recycling factor [Verrucomicrobiae bacterium]|nr:ribosome recycling factor [Verrucomicrobiae bacterium]